MKVLNRPMFRMGGPIKEGIMDGIREPRQRYQDAGQVFKNVQANLQEGQVGDPKVLQEAARLEIGNPYKQNKFVPYLKNRVVTKPTDLAEVDMATIGGYGEIEKPFLEFEKIPKYIEDIDGDGIRDLNPEYVKNKTFINDIFGGPYKRKKDESFAPKISDINQKKAEIGMPENLSLNAGKENVIDKVIENKGKIEDTPPTRKEKINTILEGLGYDRAQKNALYDAMIKAGQRISRTGLGAENLVSDVIAETSQSYDKPEKLREAANLMQVQQDLKLDQIKAGKSNKTEEDFNFYVKQFGGGEEGKKKALRMLTKDASSEMEAYFDIKNKTGSGLDGVKAGIEWMIRDGQIGENENKGEIIKKSHKDIKEFVKSDEFKRKGAGVYQLEGIVARIDADGSVDIIKSFGTISEKTNSWWGFGS